ncbi:MAG: ABC transporter permease, partial [Actinobacteria bacterium]|nr:ABC transporter permease [Actinomycetota bacterium]
NKLLGYDPSRGGGPWKLSRGRDVEAADEVVVDRVLAQRYGLQMGGPLDILGRRFRIVGLSDGTASWMVSMLFLRRDAAASLLRVPGATSFVLVNAGPEVEMLARLRAALPGASVTPHDVVAANDRDYIGGIFGGPLRLMVLISLAIGAMLVGLTIYAATMERVREYGVLKALGIGNGRLYSIVIRQTLAVTALGFVVGLVLVGLVAAGIEGRWPQFLIVVDGRAIAAAGIGALALAVTAATLPARYVATIDPASAFRR